MEVSIWWVVVASFVSMWTGFFLCAALTMAQRGEEDEQLLAPGAGMKTLV